MTTTSNGNRLAAQAVFNTYEVVELIIIALPFEDIILQAKVNKRAIRHYDLSCSG